jgi:hypothetical protein
MNEQRDKMERKLQRLYDELREMESHPDFPWIDEIPGYQFVCQEIDYLESLLSI